MVAEELMAIIEEVLARELAKRVMEKLRERQKRAVVVYTGSNIGASTALEELRALRDKGFTYRIFFTRNAARILDTEKICATLEPEEVWIDIPGEIPEILTRQYDTFLVPALTVNTAAHVASCMADTPGAAIILDALMRGKNVILARDGCCPDNPERVQRGFHMAPALKERLRENLRILQSYGARLCGADGLEQAALQSISEGFSISSERDTPSGGSTQTHSSPSLSGREVELPLEGNVLSISHLNHCPSHTTLLVPKGTLITQLSADDARRRGIQIKIKT